MWDLLSLFVWISLAGDCHRYMCESAACTFDHKGERLAAHLEGDVLVIAWRVAVLCKEVFRVLKPGARFTGFDWQMTDKFDESNGAP